MNQTMQEATCLISNNVGRGDHDHQQNLYRIFVGSWNVGGVPPPDNMEDMMRDWISSSTNDKPADVYVFGFQEIVPLNARNVIVSENNKISMKWNSLIRAALNKKIPTIVEEDNIVGEIQKVYPIKDDSSSANSVGSRSNRHEFGCIISKQMVGIFLTVWVRSDLRQCIRNLSVSCIGCGLMSYLGNKGSVSIRFWLHETSLCFVCSHLASGGKEGDERRRNANVSQILSNTSFPSGPSHNLPRKIIDHDCIIWLGDMNYRIYLPEDLTRFLVENEEWNVLLEKDQLKVELMEGRIFHGWSEGAINFPPTYKYNSNSEAYFGFPQNDEKCQNRRAPAWCDRIIWFGKGLTQNHYGRGELRLSDHRPVRAIFTYSHNQHANYS